MATAVETIAVPTEPILRPKSWRSTTLRNVRRNPVGAAAGVACFLLVLLAIFGATFAPYDASNISFERLQAPSADHPFGTDSLSRDLLSRIMHGAWNSLGVAFVAIAVSTVLGVFLGVMSGYVGGVFDLVTSRFIDVMLAYPATYRSGRLRRSWRTFRRSPLVQRDLWDQLRDYNRPDFHPDDRDASALIER